jgi:hypothetical protein
VDATTVVAIAGLLATAATALGVPLLQHRMAKAERLHDMRVAVYTDAMAYVAHIEARIDRDLDDPDLRSGWNPIEVAHPGLIGARLQLVAPQEVAQGWKELAAAWDALAWNTEQDGPINDHGEYLLTADQPDVLRVRAASASLARSLCREVVR